MSCYEYQPRAAHIMRIMGRKVRVRLLPKMLAVCLAIVAAFALFWCYWALPRFQSDKLHDKEMKAREEVEIAWCMADYWHQLETLGVVTPSEAQEAALAEIAGLRFNAEEGGGYFWITDYTPVLLLDPSVPHLTGTDVGDVRDVNGNYIYRDMVQLVNTEGGAPYTFQQVPTGGTETVTKLCYVKSFESWGWVIGTGVHVEEVIAAYRSWRDLVGWALGAVALLSVVGFWLFARYAVQKPMSRLVEVSDGLASGDVNQEIKITSSDEVGALATAYTRVIDYMKDMANVTSRLADADLTVEVQPRSEKDALGNSFAQLVGRQRELIGKVKGTASSVAEASRQLSSASEQTSQAMQQITATMQQIAKGASEQSSSLQLTVENIDQLAAAINQIAEGSGVQTRGVEEASSIVKNVSSAIADVAANSQAGIETWKSTSTSATEGARLTHEMVEDMGQIKKAMDTVLGKAADLGARSEEIGKIVATIDDIAAQTNLLALNAAIEAARAGEQGRGFAVVADEVRKLAERSSSATKEIDLLVSGIQASVRDVVTAMQQGSAEVEGGYALASDAGSALNAIFERSEDVGRQIERISAAAHRLSALSDQMVEAIDVINRIAEQNAAATGQMRQSSADVLEATSSAAGIAEEHSAAAQEVSAGVEEMSAQVEETLAAAQSLTEMSDEMKKNASVFRVPGS